MNDQTIIYVAGNPNAYPLEYYDEASQTYEGVIPKLLREFSAQSRYEVVYYQPSKSDERAHLAKNLQVDLVSGYMQGEEIPANTQQTAVFHTMRGNEEISYVLCYTPAAPQSFCLELDAFLQSVSNEQITGLLLDTAQVPQQDTSLWFAVGALAATVLLYVCVIIALIRRYRKKLKQAQSEREIDETTGLGNLDYFVRYYHQMVNDKNRLLYHLLYFYVDTDALRRVGSAEETDDFLRYCAMVLQEYTGDMDLLAKVSVHGFALLKLSGDTAQIKQWITPVFDRIHAYTKTYGKPFDVHVTAGIYSIKTGDRDLNEMLFNASQSAYAAKNEQEDYLVCSDQMLSRMIQEKQLQADIERAFAKQEFEVYIQFYVDAYSRQIVGGEALSRWNHPQKGVLSPGTFVSLMERGKMISQLDYYSLEKICSFLADLSAQGIETFFVSCNFSRETFAAPDFVDHCQEIIGAYTFPKDLLIFEITESVSVKNSSQIQKNMIALRKYGIRIALDDFGEGFTSFYDLQKYPIDGIKLDKGLVDHVMTKTGHTVLKAMIQVGHELGITILAEGVETEEQAQVLKSLHCDVIQGFQFYFPLPEWEAKTKILEQFCV